MSDVRRAYNDIFVNFMNDIERLLLIEDFFRINEMLEGLAALVEELPQLCVLMDVLCPKLRNYLVLTVDHTVFFISFDSLMSWTLEN